jgi:hypothetical protein
MSAARAVTMAAATWLAPTGLLIAGAALGAVLLRPAGERGLVEEGAAYAIVTYDLVLPLVGLGVALATMTRRQAVLVAVILLGCVPVGIHGEHRLLWAAGLPPNLARHFTYLGPLCCAVAGLTLAAAGRLRRWLMPAATALCGAALGFLAALHDPTAGDPRFACGAAAVGLWLMMAPPAFLQLFDRSWLWIGDRILASWLVAFGLLLSGSKFIAQQRADRAFVSPQLFVQPPASIDPDAAAESSDFEGSRERHDKSREP